MKRLSVKMALLFAGIVLTVTAAAAILLYIVYRNSVMDTMYQEVKVLYEETSHLLKQQQAGTIDQTVLTTGMDSIARVGIAKLYVIRYDPNRLDETSIPESEAGTVTLAEDLALIAQGKTVFRELVYRAQRETPYVFFGGPAPSLQGSQAILVYAAAGPLYDQVTKAARLIILGAFAAMLLSTLAIFAAAERLVRPLRSMSRQALQLAQGENLEDIPVRTKDEIGQLTRAFNHLKRQVLDNERTRKEFLATVSHDLRTPLTHIRTSALGLKDGWVPEEMKDKALGIIADESQRLIHMTSGILEATRLESGSMELQKTVVDLASLMRETADASAKPERVLVDCPQTLNVSLDESLIRRALANLLDNAFRYGRGDVEMRAYQQGDTICLTVQDHGPGLPEQELGKIFDKFYRCAGQAAPEGIGIGLYTVRQTMFLHGGRAYAENAEGGGLKITLAFSFIS